MVLAFIVNGCDRGVVGLNDLLLFIALFICDETVSFSGGGVDGVADDLAFEPVVATSANDHILGFGV